MRITLAKLDEVFIILKDLRIFLEVAPVEVVDAVRRLVGVVYSLLVAQHLFTAQDEGDTLRREDGSLCQQVETDKLLLGDARNTRLETVNKTHIVVTGDVRHHLCGLCCPRSLGVVHLGHIYLRMADAAHDTELQTLLHIGSATKNTRFRVVVERTAQSIAYLVRKSSYSRCLLDMCLHSQFLVRISTAACAPSFAVDED